MEYLDIVNLKDEVVSQATREEIYQQKLAHRIVHLFIFDEDDRLALQLRSAKVKFCPNCWSTIVGGHVQSGETYEEAILRESEEEIGIKPEIEFFSYDSYSKDGLNKFLKVYKTNFKGELKPNPEDIQKVSYFSLKELQEMVKKGEKFHPELLFLLEKYFN